MDYEAQDEAVLAKILIQEGAADVSVGTPIMVLVENVEDAAAFKDFSPEGGAPASAPAPAAPAPAAAAPAPAPTVAAPAPSPAAPAPAPVPATSGSGGRVLASPLAKLVSVGSEL